MGGRRGGGGKDGEHGRTAAAAAEAARVAPARSKLSPRMGFHHRGMQYLHPEEAAFLVDRGDLVLAVGVERARKGAEEEEGERKEEEDAADDRENDDDDDDDDDDGDGDSSSSSSRSSSKASRRGPLPSPAACRARRGPECARALSVQEAMSLSVSRN